LQLAFLVSELHSSAVIVRPQDIQHIGNEVAVKWSDGQESYFTLEELRRACPCAGCKGETDVMGNLHRLPAKPLSPASFQLRSISSVGSYAVQFLWGDGHNSGIFSFDYLRALADKKAS
jgi:DUF971 family protein